MRKFKFYSDAGHGWLKVHALDLLDLNMTDRDFSAFSYKEGEWLYLEEDCDASKFIQAYDRMFGIGQFGIIEVYQGDHSPIRNLPRNQ